MDPSDKILELFKEKQSILQSELVSALKAKGVAGEVLEGAINCLLTSGKIQVLPGANGQMTFQLVAEAERSKLAGLSPQDLAIYDIIKQTSSKGAWSKDLRFKTNMQMLQIGKILKVLQSRKLVKQVKSPTQRGKKLFMLYELEPAKDIWYQSDQTFDSVFVNSLREMCRTFFMRKGYASAEDILGAVRNSGVFKIELRLEDIHQIIDTLVYDGDITPCQINGQVLFRFTKRVGWHNNFTPIPCSGCPIFSECVNDDTAPISPQHCEYLTKWLEADIESTTT